MSTTSQAVASDAHLTAGRSPWLLAAWVCGPFLLLWLLRNTLPAWMVTVPKPMVAPFIDWINAVVEFLRKYEFLGLFTFKDVTRGTAKLLEWPLDFLESLLISGFDSLSIPPLPWVMLVGLVAVWGWYLKGWRLALLGGGCIFYLALFGKWKLSMLTLSAVLVAAPIAGLIGLVLGIAAAKSRRFESILWPLLNVMQSMPHFSYLIPVAVFVGVGPRAGLVATILFAMPPMARLTLLGLRGVSPEVVEAGVMAGCTPRQMLYKVEVAAARPSIMIGVNQIIMQCLAMVVIASFIGAKGLGHDLLVRLQSLRIGQSLEIGVAIVLIAVTLDQLSQAWAEKQPQHKESGPFWKVHPFLTAAAGVVIGSLVLTLITPHASVLPRELTITTAPFWDGIVDYVTLHFYEPLAIFRDGLLVNVLIPLRSLFQSIPWIAAVALVGCVGWYIGNWKLAGVVMGFTLFIAFSGFWPRSLITSYMVAFSVFVCVLFGVPLAVWASRRESTSKFVNFLCDTFQTFPSFIYLIPVIMLFQVGDVAAITAIVIYAGIPAVRYTIIGLRSIPHEIVEAAITSGCTPAQTLWKVRLPLAIPEMMLGINQTIMFALFMVMIAGFIGTKDLGQEIFRALTFNDAGKGIVIGLCVAFIGLTADRLITEWSNQRKQSLGLV